MYVCCVYTQLSADSFMRQDVEGVSLLGLFGSGGQHWTLSFLESESAAHAAPRHFHLESKQLSVAKSLLSLIRPVVRRRHQSGAQTTVTSWLADYACLPACACVCAYMCVTCLTCFHWHCWFFFSLACKFVVRLSVETGYEKKFSKIEIDIVLIEIPRAKVLMRHVEKCDLIAKQTVHSVLNLAVFVRKLPSYFCCCCCLQL